MYVWVYPEDGGKVLPKRWQPSPCCNLNDTCFPVISQISFGIIEEKYTGTDPNTTPPPPRPVARSYTAAPRMLNGRVLEFARTNNFTGYHQRHLSSATVAILKILVWAACSVRQHSSPPSTGLLVGYFTTLRQFPRLCKWNGARCDDSKRNGKSSMW
jgi:hypothetical protein